MRDFGGLPFIDYSARFEQGQSNPLEALTLGQQVASRRETNQLEQLKLLAQQQKDLHIQEVAQRVAFNPNDSNARAMLASLSPQAHEAVIKDLDYRSAQANQLLGAFKKAPAAQKPELYQRILPALNQLIGEDAKYLPQEYGTNAEDAVNYYFDQTRSTTDALKDEKAKLEQQEIMARTGTQRAHANLYNQQALSEPLQRQKLQADITKIQAEKQPKPLTSEAAKLTGLASSGLQALTELEDLITVRDEQGNIITRDVPTTFLPNILQGEKRQTIENLQINLSDIIGRLRSGAAINKGEEERFKKLIPKWNDKPAVIEHKIKTIRKEFGEMINKLDKGSINFSNQDSVHNFEGHSYKIRRK